MRRVKAVIPNKTSFPRRSWLLFKIRHSFCPFKVSRCKFTDNAERFYCDGCGAYIYVYS